MQSTAEVMVVNSNNVLNSLINAEEDLKVIENSNVTGTFIWRLIIVLIILSVAFLFKLFKP